MATFVSSHFGYQGFDYYSLNHEGRDQHSTAILTPDFCYAKDDPFYFNNSNVSVGKDIELELVFNAEKAWNSLFDNEKHSKNDFSKNNADAVISQLLHQARWLPRAHSNAVMRAHFGDHFEKNAFRKFKLSDYGFLVSLPGIGKRKRVLKSGEVEVDRFRSAYLALHRSLPPLRTIFPGGEKSYLASPRRIASFLARGCSDAEQSLFREYYESIVSKCEVYSGLVSIEEVAHRVLSAKANNVMMPSKHGRIYQDMSLPLSEYFISSSHNSYLDGNQWNSRSSPSSVSRALLLGVRVIELDCHDGPNGIPIVTHGKTLCEATSFEDCIAAINEYAHAVSIYPVILTIENHCSLLGQKNQAEILCRILGDKLYRPDHGPPGSRSLRQMAFGDMGDWLSPESLKGYVVLREKPWKRAKKKDKRAISYMDASSNRPVSELDLSLLDYLMYSPVDESDDETYPKKPYGFAHPNLLQLIYIRNVGLECEKVGEKLNARMLYKPPAFNASHSIDEVKLMKLAKTEARRTSLAQYTSQMLLRVYPRGARIDSSNFDPTLAWTSGCHMVSLNVQTKDKGLWLTYGKFRDNGGCGYLLKPERLRNPFYQNLSNEVKHSRPIMQKKLNSLRITILSGHYLRNTCLEKNQNRTIGENGKPARVNFLAVDPHVELTISGAKSDLQTYRTRPVRGNGFNPVFDQMDPIIIDFEVPSLTMLLFCVKSGSSLLGQACFSCDLIREGYRRVPLLDSSCKQVKHSFLFCHFAFK